MALCAHCTGQVEEEHRFCPWCAAPQRRKLVEFFAPHPAVDGDAQKAPKRPLIDQLKDTLRL
jgi:predicted amidophosphoribosyltransferase